MAETGIGASVRRKEDFRFLTGAGRYTDTLAKVRKVQHGSQHFAVEGSANIRIGRITNSQHTADIQQLNRITRLKRCRHMPGVTA